MVLPVMDPDFWKGRLEEARKLDKDVWYSILNTSEENWNKTQEHHSIIMGRFLKPNDGVLDAGCGCGSLVECLPVLDPPLRYVGVDISPDLIAAARKRYQGFDFMVGDLRNLPFIDKQFDWGVCRGVEGMIKENVGEEEWIKMKTELLRVCKKILLLASTVPTYFQVLEK